MKCSMDRFESLVRDAIDTIPGEFQPYLDGIEFVVARRSAEGMFGLYEGAGALADEEALPARITIFKESHEAAADTWEALVEEVRRTVLHEVGHHFHMGEAEMPY
ncbi:MAG TPA: metallopeptidase family protein [Candidatus Dormibacteraeota bacterium]|nr:metallopeptidase family protein [Candidatus Dormibacteraeota bacterium]